MAKRKKKPLKKYKVYFIEDNDDMYNSLIGCIELHDVLWPRCSFKRFTDTIKAVRSSVVPPDVVLVDAGSIRVYQGCYTQMAARAIERLADRWSSATYLIYSALGGVVDLDWVVDDFKKTVADARCIGTSQDIEWALACALGLD